MAKQNAFFEYKSVEGIDDVLLDACLLLTMEKETLIDRIKKEKYFLARTGIPVKRLVKKEVEKSELIQSMSPYLKDRQDLYNALVGFSNALLEKAYLSEMEGEITDESTFLFLKDKFQEKELPYGLFINWLRFQDDYHSAIAEVFEASGLSFQKETGLSLPPQISIKEKETGSFSAELDQVIQALERLKTTVTATDDREKYEEEKRKAEQLAAERDKAVKECKAVNTQIKAKEQLLVKKEKEITQLKKKLNAETETLKKKNKETGQIAAELGELRKELAVMLDERDRFKRESENAKAVKAAALKDQEEKITQQLYSEHALVLDDYKNKLNSLERDNERLYKQLQDMQQERELYTSQQEEIERLTAQLLLYEKRFGEEGKQQEAAVSCSKEKASPEELIEEGLGELEKWMGEAGQNEPSFSG